MQTGRMFEIVYILLSKEHVTAAELAERFEVSTRTIYRDIDALSSAGIPVYAAAGRGGGIRLLPEFVLNKSLLTDKEQGEIMAALTTFSAAGVPDAENVIDKLSGLFSNAAMAKTEWIQVDFSDWGVERNELFTMVKLAILGREVLSFDYYNTAGKKSTREIEPVQLWFKHRAWYVRAYCRTKAGPRIFKLNRMRNVKVVPHDQWHDFQWHEEVEDISADAPRIHLVFQLNASAGYRVYDEFAPTQVTVLKNGDYQIEADFIEDEWIYGYLLTFAPYIRIISPEHVKFSLKKRIEKFLENNIT